MMDPVPGSIVATVPARSDFLGILRSFTGVVAAELALSLDDIDDLRLAIDEAFTYLLTGGTSASSVTVTFLAAPQELIVTLRIEADPLPWPPPDAEESLAWKVMSGLVDRVELERGPDGGPTIVIVKKTLDAPSA
jgi:serine/threonine-protein kinase RsbW